MSRGIRSEVVVQQNKARDLFYHSLSRNKCYLFISLACIVSRLIMIRRTTESEQTFNPSFLIFYFFILFLGVSE